jgi:uncharacterized membrane protein
MADGSQPVANAKWQRPWTFLPGGVRVSEALAGAESCSAMSAKENVTNQPRPVGVAPVVERNIRALLAKRDQEEAQLRWPEKLANAITRFTGTLTFVLLHVVLYGLWIAINVGWIKGVPRFDPTLVILAMEASVEAIFLSSFILITQNRMMSAADRQASLSLQISLLAEHEVTRLIEMVSEIGKKMGAESAQQPELTELARDVEPEKVLDIMDKHEEDMRQQKAAGGGR